ncbi:hypothetical protein MKEN_00291600 [Mycena kentingensis (nom. inval.)]|nr:hypothetical protein MKEN_00291600 [Mycena kentingensis (nom. inval.)]
MSRRIVLDDIDPGIEYSAGDWFTVDPATLDYATNYGPIFNMTTRATTTTNATFEMAFSGSAVRVFGTIAVTTTNGVTDPSWECLVDGKAISQPDNAFPYPESNWMLCKDETLAGGEHTLRVKVTTSGRPFYLDYVDYTPLPDESPASPTLLVIHNDPSVAFGTGWTAFEPEMISNIGGSQVTFNFHGSYVTMYGFVPVERPHAATWGTYAIDNDAPVNFTLNGLDARETNTFYNTPIFTTPRLTNAMHTMVVTYGGDADHTPLVLDHFYVSNHSLTTPQVALNPYNPTTALPFSTPTIGGPSLATSVSASTSPATSAKQHRSSAAAISGGAIAGVFVLSILASILFCYIRRRRRQRLALAGGLVDPWVAGPAAADMGPRFGRREGPGADARSTNTSAVAYSFVDLARAAARGVSLRGGSRSRSRGAGTRTGTMTGTWSDSGTGLMSERGAPSTRSYPTVSHPSLYSGARTATATYTGTGTATASLFWSVNGNATAEADERTLSSSLSALVMHPGPARKYPAGPSAQQPPPPMVLQHQDSGVRLQPPPPRSPLQEVVEVPPGYSYS